MIKVSQILVAYIEEIPGHRDHQGCEAPFVIKSHHTDKILSSHPTRDKAKEYLRRMHVVGD